MTKNIKSELLSGFVYTCTVNWFCVHLYCRLVLCALVLYAYRQECHIDVMDITSKGNVQGTDITSEKNV